MTMNAIEIAAFGGPEALALRTVAAPRPGPGEVAVRLAHAGVNFMDVYMRNGTYARSDTYKTPLPMVIGMEGAGTVLALGEEVEGFAIGDRVAYCLSRGAYAEVAVVPAWRLVPVPEAGAARRGLRRPCCRAARRITSATPPIPSRRATPA
jgi:NADPH2:quinone reductase